MKILSCTLLLLSSLSLFSCNSGNNTPTNGPVSEPLATPEEPKQVIVGAARTSEYLPLLDDKAVGMVVNQTSTIGSTHLVDSLLSLGVEIKKVFAPEHGFRGEADAGATIADEKDVKTGLPIISLYGNNKKPSAAQLADLDVVIFDIQDVGARFYTYISTMHYLMEACAENDVDVLVLDRPNPTGHFVDGPILNMEYQSFVGMHPIPIAHGLTVAELATMINGERWLKDGNYCSLSYVLCENYDHNTAYELPIKPSPNLPNARSIELYPTLCLLEASTLSVGRGTDNQFQLAGSPAYTGVIPPDDANFIEFMPVKMPGAQWPKHENVSCTGYDLSQEMEGFENWDQINLEFILHLYNLHPDKEDFWKGDNLLEKLVGNNEFRKQVEAGLTAGEIRLTWQEGLDNYKAMRKQYLLYPDFE